MEFLDTVMSTAAALPRFIEAQDRLALIAVSVISTAVAMGTVVRNHEFNLSGKVFGGLFVFALLFAGGLALANYAPAWFEVARQARGGQP